MANFNSDDLLIKSQLLISKFRKQREASMKKQEYVQNKNYPNHNPIICDQMNTEYFSDKCFPGNEPYPQRNGDNYILNKFNKQYYIPNSIKSYKKKQLNSCKNDDTINTDNLSDSDNSSWSTTVESHNTEIYYKAPVGKREFGVMTDSDRIFIIEDEDIFTPVSALPPTIRSSVTDRNKHPALKETRSLNDDKHKKYSTICTNYDSDHTSRNLTKKVLERRNSYSKQSEIACDKIDILTEDNDVYNDENNKMKFALQLFQHEKQLETEIIKLVEQLDKLNAERTQLTARINNEHEHLNGLKSQKAELKSRRYEIFNGLSNELNIGVYENQVETNRSNQSNTNDPSEILPETNLISDDNRKNSCSYALDSETVRNIVDKIIFKEFSNSEDNIFIKNKLSNILKDSERENNENSQSDEECILSDVMSVKDLKISHRSMDVDNSNCHNRANPSNDSSNFHNSFPPRTPQWKPTKIQTAQSVDNLDKSCKTSNNGNSRLRLRRKIRNPSASEEIKKYVNCRSSSEDSISDSTYRDIQG